MKKITSMMMFHNGSFAAFDENGKQVPEMQALTAVDLWIDRAVQAGFDVKGCKVDVGCLSGEIRETRSGLGFVGEYDE
jgi:hypothetical protein